MMIAFEPILILVLAFVTDIAFGDPPNRFHPVAWMGSCIAWFRDQANSGGDIRRLLSGTLMIFSGACAVVGLGLLIERGCRERSLLVTVAIQSLVLKCTFSARSLARAASSIAKSLESNDIHLAREQVSFHLVSRDVSTLDASDLSAATIESVAENTSDSIIAPLFYFAIAGLPGAFVYRFVNTCDAMLGYRTADLEWFGKPAARLDDLLNLLPSRLTALIMLGMGAVSGSAGVSRRAVMIWWRDHALTASPNAGHPMSAAAGVLGVALEKRGHYRLGAELPPPSAVAISNSIRLLWATTVFAVLFFATALWFRRFA